MTNDVWAAQSWHSPDDVDVVRDVDATTARSAGILFFDDCSKADPWEQCCWAARASRSAVPYLLDGHTGQSGQATAAPWIVVDAMTAPIWIPT